MCIFNCTSNIKLDLYSVSRTFLGFFIDFNVYKNFLGLQKNFFFVLVVCVSTCFAISPPYSEGSIYYLFDHFAFCGFRILNITLARHEPLVKFLPLILDKLLHLMVKPPTVAGSVLNLGQTTFEAIGLVVKQITVSKKYLKNGKIVLFIFRSFKL